MKFHMTLTIDLLIFAIICDIKTVLSEISEISSILNFSDTSKSQANIKLVFNLYGNAINGYYIILPVGTPAQQMKFLIDTGSSNIALLCEKNINTAYYFHPKNSSTFSLGHMLLYVPYSQGTWIGYLGNDIFTFTDTHNKTHKVIFDIGCIRKSHDIFYPGCPWDGILGLAHKDILQPDTKKMFSFIDTLKKSLGMDSKFEITICPTNPTSKAPMGALILQRSANHSNDLAPKTGEAVFKGHVVKRWFYNMVLAGIYVNESSLEEDCRFLNVFDVLLDTGTTDIKMPRIFIQKIIDHFKLTTYYKVNSFTLESSTNPVLCFNESYTIDRYRLPLISIEFISKAKNMTFKLILSSDDYLIPINMSDETFSADSNGDNKGQMARRCFKFTFSEAETNIVIGAIAMKGLTLLYDRETSSVEFSMPSSQLCRNQTNLIPKLLGPMPYPDDLLKHCTNTKGLLSPYHVMITSAYIIATFCMVIFLTVITTSQCRNATKRLKTHR